MPPPELENRRQTAVLWMANGTDSYGQFTVTTPVEIMVRWETTRRITQDPQNNIIPLDADVFVDRVIKVGSVMWLGTLASWNGGASSASDTELMEVKDFKNIPDIKNRFTTRRVGLSRLRNTLPTIA